MKQVRGLAVAQGKGVEVVALLGVGPLEVLSEPGLQVGVRGVAGHQEEMLEFRGDGLGRLGGSMIKHGFLRGDAGNFESIGALGEPKLGFQLIKSRKGDRGTADRLDSFFRHCIACSEG